MEDLQSRARAVVAGVHVADLVSPLLGGLDELAVGARVGPSGGILGGGSARDGEAAGGDTGVYGTGLEDVGVRGDEDVGHHGARAGADGEDSVGVSAVLVYGVLDHVGNGLAVTATVVGKS